MPDRAAAKRMAVEEYASGVGPPPAVDRLQQLGPTGTDEPRDTHDLAGAHRQRHVVELPAPGQSIDSEQLVAGRLLTGRGEDVLDRAPCHQPNQIGCCRLPGLEVLGDRSPVLENGDPVTDLAYLVQPV